MLKKDYKLNKCNKKMANNSKCKNDDSKKTIYVWLGGVAPSERFDELVKLGDRQFAANNMQLLYIDGIEKNINSEMSIISSHFIPFSFKNKKIFKRAKYGKYIDVGFINFPVLKQISKAINVAREVKEIIKNNRNCNFVFFIYSMTTPLMYSSKIIYKLQ